MKILYIYLLLPLLVAFLISTFRFIKNSIFIKRIVNVCFSIEFLLSSFGIFYFKNVQFTMFNLDFNIDKFTLYFSFLLSFLFLLFSIFSKGFIRSSYRLFYSAFCLLFGIINLALFCDNIFLLLIILFWYLLLDYFLNISFSEIENKIICFKQLLCSLFWYIIAIILIFKDFIRYFVINDISFTFSNLVQNIYQIDDKTILIALVGFLILTFQLFKFLPFSSKSLCLLGKTNSFVSSLFNINSIILGSYLFSKIYLNFNYLFYQIQESLVIYFLINLVYYVLLSYRQNSLFKFLTVAFIVNIIIGIFPIFTFEQESFYAFSYYIFALCISYTLCAFIFMVVQNAMSTDKIDDFKRINDRTKIIQLFLIFALLNLASVPFFAFFGAKLINFMMIFSVEYNEFILDLSPYIVLFSTFLLSISVVSLIYKVLIEPCENMDRFISLSKHQIIVFLILIFVIFLLGIYPQYIFNQFDTILNIGNF